MLLTADVITNSFNKLVNQIHTHYAAGGTSFSETKRCTVKYAKETFV